MSGYPQYQLKQVATINDEALGENTPDHFELQYIDIGNVNSLGKVDEVVNYRFEDAPSRARRLVRDGDIIISTVRTYLQAIAPIENPPDNLVVSTGFAVVRPKTEFLDTKYCKYALREPSFIHEVVSRSVGVSYPAINASELSNIPINIPPLRQQKAIAEYLDRETAAIDTLVSSMERLLALLSEKRQAVITHAVTRGLDPSVPLRDTGVAWIGRVPAHWVLNQLKFISHSLQTGPFGSQLHVTDYVVNGIPVINPVHMINGQIVYDERITVEKRTVDRLSVHKLEVGDVLLARRGEIGRCAVVGKQEEGWLCGTGNLRVRPDQSVLDPFYLVHLLLFSPVRAQLKATSVGTTMQNINTEIVGDLTIPLPSIQEQKGIVNQINDKVNQLDLLEHSIKKSILLLHERRVSLISSAVTGQIRIKT